MNNPDNPTLVLLYSQKSPKCNQLRAMLKDEYLGLFRPICVDNGQVRSLLQNSTTLKIKSVPCVIEVFSDGNLASYEDAKAFEWMSNFINVIEKKPDPRTSNPVHRNSHPQNSGVPGMRKIDDIYSDNIPEDQGDFPSSMASMGGGNIQDRSSRGVDMPVKNPNLSALRGPRRAAYRGEVDEEDNGFTGITSNRDVRREGIMRPSRGEGHQGMSSSSLPDVDLGDDMPMEPQRPRRQVPVVAGKNRVKIIEDITPDEEEIDNGMIQMDNDDPSGMGVPRPDGNTEMRGNRGARERSNNLKNMAMSIERARKMEEEQIESHKQGNTMVQREMAIDEPINL